MVEAYVNRGYVLNDMQNAEQATQDFQSASSCSRIMAPPTSDWLLPISNFAMERSRSTKPTKAEKILGESGATHLALATAFRQQRLLTRPRRNIASRSSMLPTTSSCTWRSPTPSTTCAASPIARTLNEALRLSPDDPLIYAEMAHAHAEIRHRDETLQYVQAAEQAGGDQSAILLNTGDALLDPRRS